MCDFPIPAKKIINRFVLLLDILNFWDIHTKYARTTQVSWDQLLIKHPADFSQTQGKLACEIENIMKEMLRYVVKVYTSAPVVNRQRFSNLF